MPFKVKHSGILLLILIFELHLFLASCWRIHILCCNLSRNYCIVLDIFEELLVIVKLRAIVVVHWYNFCFFHFFVFEFVLHVEFDCLTINLIVHERVRILVVILKFLVSVKFDLLRIFHLFFIVFYFISDCFFFPLLSLLRASIELVYWFLLYFGYRVINMLQRLDERIQNIIFADHFQSKLFVQFFSVEVWIFQPIFYLFDDLTLLTYLN